MKTIQSLQKMVLQDKAVMMILYTYKQLLSHSFESI